MIARRWIPRRVAAAVALVLLAASSAPGAAEEEGAETYLDALVALAAGEADEALERLLRFETAAAPEGTDNQIDAVAREERRVARRLASESADALLPVARLHERAYLAHLSDRRLRLAIHSRETTLELARLFRAGSARPDASRLVAELLTSLGGHLQEASMGSLAIGLYERASELDPDETAPLLGLANVFERQGQYQRALPHLDRALRIAPSHREARLRRGLLLLRLGRTAQGEAALEELTTEPAVDWILSLAYQELARSRSAAGDFDRAHTLLLEAYQRLPDDPSLPVQIAYFADRTGAGESIEELGEALRDTAAAPEPSSRSVYARMTTESLEEVRDRLEGHSRQHLVYLRGGLERLVGRGAGR